MHVVSTKRLSCGWLFNFQLVRVLHLLTRQHAVIDYFGRFGKWSERLNWMKQFLNLKEAHQGVEPLLRKAIYVLLCDCLHLRLFLLS